VQEALTNVVKHAGGAPTDVSVHYRADAVEVRIADRGEAKPVTSRQARQWSLKHRLDAGGHGLVGMRERVRVYGGELHAGRRRGGGFEVRVVLPLEAEDEAALTAGARA
jgi:signal transduction histidine kinase